MLKIKSNPSVHRVFMKLIFDYSSTHSQHQNSFTCIYYTQQHEALYNFNKRIHTSRMMRNEEKERETEWGKLKEKINFSA